MVVLFAESREGLKQNNHSERVSWLLGHPIGNRRLRLEAGARDRTRGLTSGSHARVSLVRDASAGAPWWAGPTGRQLGPTGGKRREPHKRGRGEVGPASQWWRACVGTISRARADRRGPPGSDQEWGKKRGG
jgi:hypothetical protein